jgi:hypothetical protein
MAASLTFGLLFGTVLILLLVPTFYHLLARMFVETDLDDLPTAVPEADPYREPAPPVVPSAT